MKRKRLLVISADSLVGEDLEYFRTLPNYQKYIAGGSGVDRVRSIYPSLTYPAHATLMTGCYPDRTGIVSNNIYTEDTRCGDWEWDSAALRAEDIFSAAKRVGYSTASVLWPVTGCNKNIDHLVNEAWRPEAGETVQGLFARYGSSPEVIDIIMHHVGRLVPDHMQRGLAVHPEFDDFGAGCAADIIRRFKPELMLVHTCPVDACRHEYGVFSDRLEAAIRRVDAHLGEIGQALEDAGVLADTNVFLISDHGQLNCVRFASINVALSRAGFLSVGEDGRLSPDWRAYSRSAGMCAYVYLREKDDSRAYDAVYGFLKQMESSGVCGISKVYTVEEAAAERLRGDFSFVLETDGRTAFSNACDGHFMRNVEPGDEHYLNGQHGHHPDKGPQPVLEAKGPDIVPGLRIPECRLVDEAPTFAALLGVTLAGADGNALEALLK